MLMRKKPLRGEKYILAPSDVQVTFLEKADDDNAKVIFPNGVIGSTSMASLDLPLIDTSAYEKIKEC